LEWTTIYPNKKGPNTSKKIDYLAIDKNNNNVLLIELKTDNESVNEGQLEYLCEAKKVGFKELIKGIITIYSATRSKKKYEYLLKILEENTLVQIDEKTQKYVISSGINHNVEIVYILPNYNNKIGSEIEQISFDDICRIIKTNDDELSKRFAKSLSFWKIQRLSKSKCLSGRQCVKRLWLEIHKPELIPEPSPSQQRIFDQGTMIGELVWDIYKNGFLVDEDHLHIPEAIEHTNRLLASDVKIIFEGCYVFNNVLVRPDVQVKNGSTWDIIEVKSSTKVKEENIWDVAVQTWVLNGFGLKVNKKYLMHINKECVFPELSNLFETEDITGRVDSILLKIPKLVSKFHDILQKGEPDIHIGEHCKKPYDCPFYDHCWVNIPVNSIFSVPGLFWKKKEQLFNNGILLAKEIPEDFKLSNGQSRYKNSILSKKPIIDIQGIRSELEQLQYPLFFFDFETDNPVIPRFNGMKPYEAFPFQYSCHKMDKDQNISHTEYLHLNCSDPRPEIIQKLLWDLESTGSIVVYNVGFEKGILKILAEHFPDYKHQIEAIIARIWDQLTIFKKYYTDFKSNGSNSLKDILPLIIPGMDYSALVVADGKQAQVSWNEMLNESDKLKRYIMIADSKEYCKQDTLAMVKIHNHLKHL